MLLLHVVKLSIAKPAYFIAGQIGFCHSQILRQKILLRIKGMIAPAFTLAGIRHTAVFACDYRKLAVVKHAFLRGGGRIGLIHCQRVGFAYILHEL